MSDLALFMFGFGVMVTTLIASVLSGYVWFERVYREDATEARGFERASAISRPDGSVPARVP
jgi:hypothetical protein